MSYPRGLRIDSSDAPSGWWGEIWPVGALFLSTQNVNPAGPLGFGVWQPFGVGSLLLSAPGPSVVGSVTASNPSVTWKNLPTAQVFVWQRVS